MLRKIILKTPIIILFFTTTGLQLFGQHEHHHMEEGQLPLLANVDAQPFLSASVRVAEALNFIGNALPPEVRSALHELQSKSYNEETVRKVQQLLDPFCLAMIDINPESRVKVTRGPAKAYMIQEGWTTFLLKVYNQDNITARLEVESPNALPILHGSSNAHRMKEENYISPGEIDNQFAEIQIYRDRPLRSHLSGLEVQYVPILFYTKEAGSREVTLGFNVGQGTQDIGFRNTIDVLFNIKSSVKVVFDVKDHDGSPAMASFIITDGIERYADSKYQRWGGDYRRDRARTQHWQEEMSDDQKQKINLPERKRLVGIYPLPGRRLAQKDEYPDLFFQPQVYRMNGEHVYLPAGSYHVSYGRGPEYLPKYMKLEVPEGVESMEANFQLNRWIHMAELGWYSADHHIHASGCSHYESPEEGVLPQHMWRQVLGEDLNMGNNLTWGPSWYFQKQYFTGENHPISDASNILRYDVEVSGFPSSHAGHIVLLNLKEDDYPNTTLIEEWPSWTLPVLRWAKEQGGITAYAHSGWGLAPTNDTEELPNLEVPKMDGIGANEYVVTVTHDLVDFYSAGDTPWHYELNMWYHTLNSGFRTRISGETDFPCISDEKVGRARIYAQLEDGLDFDNYMKALVNGKSYVSDGYSHLIDFSVNGNNLGENGSEIKMDKPSSLNVTVRAAAFLPAEQDEIGATIASLKMNQSPYWHIERARNGTSRGITVEMIVNGIPVAEKIIEADGNWNDLKFSYDLERSSWVAFRVEGSSHTNPIFIEIDGKRILEESSVQWCRTAVDKCWDMKHTRFKREELEEAKRGYDFARRVYDQLLEESK